MTLPSLRVRARTWVRILSAWLTAQSLVQLLGIATGLLLIRFLPVREYALYTLALSVITFFTFVSDLGSTTSLFYFFQQARREEEDFRPYPAAVLSLRRVAFLVGCAAVVLAFPYASFSQGFAAGETTLATAGIALAVWFQIGSSLRVLLLRLDDRYGASYRAELAGAGVRLLFALGMIAASLLWGWLGVFASAAGATTVSLVAMTREAPLPAGSDLRPYRRKVLRYLLPTLPSALYFSVQGPLVIWLSATFGGTRNIAEVGALSRLGMLVGLFSTLTGIVFLPRLVRITDERLYRVRFFQYGSLLFFLSTALFLLASLLPEVFLWLLGEHYAGLHGELLLVVGSAGLTLLGGYVVSVNLARSWNRLQFLTVLSHAAAQAALLAVLPLATTRGVLLFNLLSSAVGLMLQLAILAIGFTRPRWVHWA